MRKKRAPDSPRAVVREFDGQLILDDPDAVAVFHAVSKHNCRTTLEMQAERVAHFKNRATVLGKSPDDVVIVLVNVDDVHGGQLADLLIPGCDWQAIRDQGEVPFARGLAARSGMQEILATFDQDAASKLLAMSELAVVVVDHDVAEVFPA